ncbi:MAG: aminoacyl-tRNA deacylase [Candidatus Hodarchaeales archaeon]
MPLKVNSSIESADKARKLAKLLDFECEFIEHPHADGSTSSGATRALGVELSRIVKCLLLRSRKKKLIFAIIGGDTKFSPKKLEIVTGEKKFSLVAKDQVQALTGFSPGGIPPFLGLHLKIPTYLDELVLIQEDMYGSGGSPFIGLRFNPQDLVAKGAKIADLAVDNPL